MKVLPKGSVKRVPGNKPMFGEQHVEQEALITADIDKDIRVNNMHFFDGAQTALHTHSVGQVLYCVYGKGLVSTETESREVEAGDVVYFPAGEKHRHGAALGQNFAHLSIILPSEMKILE